MNVTVAERGAVEGFDSADNVTVLFPLPVDGDGVTHVASDDTVHDVFDTTDTGMDPPATGDGHDESDNDKVGCTIDDPGACVTDTA